MLCPILGRTQEEANAKYEEYTSLASEDGALALFGGWTGIDVESYGDDEELRQVESNAIRSAVEGWSKSLPGVSKWTKHTVAKHIGVGGLGATVVGTAEKVADELERWVAEADVDGFNIVSSHGICNFCASSRNSNFGRHIPSHPAAMKMSLSCCFRN
jgi:alkanesulfonate monooxygenase SsuD/methylene tetrahydromethanopterin reductase-like flavin-dependent oxidoreductase (luciferase family)